MAGQTINDRLLAARHSLAGQGLAKAVCKATTEEMIGPKKKHLDYLVHCTNEPNVSVPQLANLLIERSQNTNWTVVFKALITVHHMMCYGNERFTQYLASSNCSFQLSNFLDKSGVQGARLGYDMSPFIRRYAQYLNEKALSYRTVAFDFCKVKRGKEDGTLRTMTAEKLLKTLPSLQAQLDALLEFDCTASSLTNGVINNAFMLLFRDLIRLFACYNDGIINLLEKYFDMNKKQCRDALDLYKKFLIRMDKVGEFLKVAENVGIDKGDIPDLTKAPSSLLDALEQHLATLEGRKGSAANTPTQSASNRTNVKSGVSVLSSTSTAFGTAASNANLANTGNGHIDDAVRQQALADEEAAMNQYKQAKVQSPTGGLSTNPFLSGPANNAAPIVDLFGAGAQPVDNTKASDDLLQLAGNPFADMFGAPAPAAAQPAAPAQNNMWMTNGNGFSTMAPPATNNFVTDNNFSSVFGAQDQQTAAATAVPEAANLSNPFESSPDDFPFPLDFPSPVTDTSYHHQPDAVDASILSNPFASPDDFPLDFSSPVSDTSYHHQPDAAVDANNLTNPFASPDDFFPAPLACTPVTTADLDQQQQLPGVVADPSQAAPQPTEDFFGAQASPNFFTQEVQNIETTRSVSPAKSALDDLNDSIRALVSSPARSTPPQQQQQQQQPTGVQPQEQQQQQQAFAAFDASFDAFGDMGGGQVPGGFGVDTSQAQIPVQGFGSPAKQPMQGWGNILVPTNIVSPASQISAAGQPTAATAAATGKVLTGDLDSSLASLAQNLNMNKSAQPGMQWNSPKNTAKAGGPAGGWSPQPMAATTGANYRPMGQGMMQLPATTTIMGFPTQPTTLGMQGMPGMPAMQGVQGMQGVRPMVPGAQPIQQQPQAQQPVQPAAQPQANNQVQLDPFGAL